MGTVGLRATLPAGGEATLPFVLAWHFPELTNYWNRPGRGLASSSRVPGARLGNYYTTRHADAWAVAQEVAGALDGLRARTLSFKEALFDSTLPGGGARRRLQPDEHHPHHDLPAHRGRGLPRLRGLRRQRRLLPHGLHPRLELRAGPGAPLPGPGALHAGDGLPGEHAPHGPDELPHPAAGRLRRAVGLQAGGGRADGLRAEAVPRVAALRGHRVAARAVAPGEAGDRVGLGARLLGRRRGRGDGGGAAQHLRHRVLRPQHHVRHALPGGPQGGRGDGRGPGGHGRRRRASARCTRPDAAGYDAQLWNGEYFQQRVEVREAPGDEGAQRGVAPQPDQAGGGAAALPVRRGLPLRSAPGAVVRPRDGAGLPAARGAGEAGDRGHRAPQLAPRPLRPRVPASAPTP